MPFPWGRKHTSKRLVNAKQTSVGSLFKDKLIYVLMQKFEPRTRTFRNVDLTVINITKKVWKSWICMFSTFSRLLHSILQQPPALPTCQTDAWRTRCPTMPFSAPRRVIDQGLELCSLQPEPAWIGTARGDFIELLTFLIKHTEKGWNERKRREWWAVIDY